MKTDIYQTITDKMIKELEAGIIPWHKPWIGVSGKGCISYETGKPYSLLNQYLLNGRAGEWLTYPQVVKAGGKVRKGEHASMVVFWSFVLKTETVKQYDETGAEIGEEKKMYEYPVLKSYNVFHIDQCDGVKPKHNNEVVSYDHDPIQEAERVVAGYVEREHDLKLHIYETARAFYSPSTDEVEVPESRQYKQQSEYYSTLFHELTHSTGHRSRLNRDGITKMHFFGDENYSKEELVAEFGATFLCGICGIDCEKAFKNSAAYIQGWLRALKNDRKMIVMAAAKAEKAARYILTGEK